MKLSKLTLLVLSVGLLWNSCDVVEPDEKELDITSGVVQVIYESVEEQEYGKVGRFTVYNDSSQTVHYMGYAPASPFFTSEIHRDTGWVAVIWGWCGTGAKIYGLEPEDSFTLEIPAPEEAGLWRVGFGIMDTLDWAHTEILSEPIFFTP